MRNMRTKRNRVLVYYKKKFITGIDPAALCSVVLEGEKKRGMNISIVFSADITDINEKFRHKKGDTDVISFENDVPEGGDIFISVSRAKADAKELDIGIDEEAARLIVHGTLHVCGYDHIKRTDKAIMIKKEEKYLTELGYGTMIS